MRPENLLSDSEVQQMLKDTDVDGNGTIDYEVGGVGMGWGGWVLGGAQQMLKDTETGMAAAPPTARWGGGGEGTQRCWEGRKAQCFPREAPGAGRRWD